MRISTNELHSLHEILSDNRVPLGRKLKLAVLSELDYWRDRTMPPNLLRTDFLRLVRFVPDDQTASWSARVSKAGPHGATGDDSVFKFEFDISLLGVTSRYFLKGYFFDKDNLRGVTIQSFRLIPPNAPIPLKLRNK